VDGACLTVFSCNYGLNQTLPSKDATGTNSPPMDSQNRRRVSFSLFGSSALALVASWWLLQMGGVPREAAFMGGIFVLAAAGLLRAGKRRSLRA
jgi:hypothetical protein